MESPARRRFCAAIIVMLISAHAVGADDPPHGEPEDGATLWSSGRPDGHAPIGVMGDHTHAAGEWMLSYRYMVMSMDGNRGRSGTKSLNDVLAEFPVAPTEMLMKMHMFGVMHAPTDDLTLMLMAPYIRKEMEHRTRTDVEFTTRSDGFGDIQLNGLYVLYRWARQQIHLNAGVSFPTGSIEERDDTPAAADAKLPYPMQLGSGTFDFLPGLTYLGQIDGWSWGAQALGTVRLGRNSSGYSLGDRVRFTVWGAQKLSRWLSTSLRLDGHLWGEIDGDDPDLNPAMVPTADPDRRGGERLDILVGINLYGRESWYDGQRLAIEFGVPLYEALDSPQLEADWMLTAGWQYAW
jgi:hypothetical protein